MVSKATTYDGKLTFHQFWDMFYDVSFSLVLALGVYYLKILH